MSLRVAIRPALARDPAPDPVFFIAGGPGQSALRSFPLVAPAFSKVDDRRAIVLVDQRGTGGSNALTCKPSPDAHTDEEILDATRECLSGLSGDPRYYTTSHAVADLERVRRALGYERINLVGVSYGTRVALEYLRRYRAHVRTVVLDSVVPPESVLGWDAGEKLDLALSAYFKRCAGERLCASLFPDLRAKLDGLVESVQRVPPNVTIPDPRTGILRNHVADISMVMGAVHMLTYVPETAAMLPVLIHEAHESGRVERLVTQGLIAGESLEEEMAVGMQLSVLCSEDVPLYGDADRQPTPFGRELVRRTQLQCSVWPRGEMPADFHEPVRSDVPALLLSGTLDPVTPPADAERVAATLSRSRHLTLKGQGHNVIVRGCVPDLVAEFIESADTDFDDACLKKLTDAPFFTSLSGPPP